MLTPASTPQPESVENSEMLPVHKNESSPPSLVSQVALDSAEELEVIEGSIAGEEAYMNDDWDIPRTPPENLFQSAHALSQSDMATRAQNFLQCYKLPEVPQSPPLSSPPPRRGVNLRPFWKGEFDRMSALLHDTQSELVRTQYKLSLATQEIARLKEFNGDIGLGLEEIARQRSFMREMGAILERGRFEDGSVPDWLSDESQPMSFE